MDNSYLESPTPGLAPDSHTAQQTANATELARRAARDAVESGKAYAQDAVNAAGERLTAAKDQLARAADQGTRYVTEQPGRAVAIAAAGGAVLGAILMTALRGRR